MKESNGRGPEKGKALFEITLHQRLFLQGSQEEKDQMDVQPW
jgi:hypothetical protein